MAWYDGLGYMAGGIAQGIAGLYSTNKQVQGQKDINQMNIDYAREASERDKQLWYEQQAYNSPSEQMKRLSEAGLNPNLIYGSGSATGNVASSAPNTNVAKLENPYQNYDISQHTNILGAYMDYKLKESQINVQDQTAANLGQDKINKEVQNSILQNEAYKGGLYKTWGEKLMAQDYERIGAELKNTNERTSSVIAQRGLIPYQIDQYKEGIRKTQHEIKSIVQNQRENDYRYYNVLPRELESLNTAISGQKKNQRDQDYRYKYFMPKESEAMQQQNFARGLENQYNDQYSGYFHRYNSNLIEKFFGTALMNLYQTGDKIKSKFR